MLHDTIGFVEITELPVTAVEGTILFLEKDTPTRPRGHYQFTDGEWHPIASSEGGSVTNISSLVPTFRPAVGTVITNQLDQRDRVLADGSAHLSSSYPVLAGIINTGLPSTSDSEFEDPIGIVKSRAVANGLWYFISSENELLKFNPETLKVEERQTLILSEVTTADVVISDGNVFAIGGESTRKWGMLDRETGSVRYFGPKLIDAHENESATHGIVNSIVEVGGRVFVGLSSRYSNSGVWSKALVEIDLVSGAFGQDWAVGGNIQGMKVENGKILIQVGGEVKEFDPDSGTLSATDLPRLNAAKDDKYIYERSKNDIRRISKETGRQETVFKGSNLSAEDSAAGAPVISGDYVVFAVDFTQGGSSRYALVFVNRHTLEIELRLSPEDLGATRRYADQDLWVHVSDKGIYLPSPYSGSIPQMFNFKEFTAPLIEDVIPGVPVLIQAR